LASQNHLTAARMIRTYPLAVEPWRRARQTRERRAMIVFILVLKLSER